jgi:hypothetical protein
VVDCQINPIADAVRWARYEPLHAAGMRALRFGNAGMIDAACVFAIS